TGNLREKFTGHTGVVESIAFAQTGRRLISGSRDTTALVWDLNGRVADAFAPVRADELPKLLDDLEGDNTVRAYHAVARLAGSPVASIRLVQQKLRPVKAADPNLVTQWIGEL